SSALYDALIWLHVIKPGDANKPSGSTTSTSSSKSGKVPLTAWESIDEVGRRMNGGPAYFSDMEQSNALPHRLLSNIAKIESHYKADALSPKGALGPFQFMPGTAKQYGLSDPTNLHDSADAAARMMHDLMKKYKGNVERSLAAYNWG